MKIFRFHSKEKKQKDKNPSFYTNQFFKEHPKVLSVISTRHGGVSQAHLDSLNMSFRVGDKPENVVENRHRSSSGSLRQ